VEVTNINNNVRFIVFSAMKLTFIGLISFTILCCCFFSCKKSDNSASNTVTIPIAIDTPAFVGNWERIALWTDHNNDGILDSSETFQYPPFDMRCFYVNGVMKDSEAPTEVYVSSWYFNDSTRTSFYEVYPGDTPLYKIFNVTDTSLDLLEIRSRDHNIYKKYH